MITVDNFRLAGVQVFLYLADGGQFDSGRVLSGVLHSHLDTLNGPPRVTPIQGGMQAAPNTSQIELSSTSNEWQFKGNPLALVCIWSGAPKDGSPKTLSERAVECVSICLSAAGDKINIGRIGINVFREADGSSDDVAHHFFLPEMFDSSRDSAPLRNGRVVSISNYKVYTLRDDELQLQVNSSVEINGDKNTNSITFKNDINTLFEETSRRQFSDDEIRRFVDKACSEVDDILAKYFPTGDKQ